MSTGRLLEGRIPLWVLGPVTVPALIVIGAADRMFDIAVRLTVLYLLPVAAAAWFGGRTFGVAIAILAALAQLGIDLLSTEFRWTLPLWNLAADLLVYVGAALLLSALRARLDAADRDARTDALTGLRNARAFRDAAEAELSRSRRYGHPLTLALIDIDDFKRVNDTYGHGVGDEVLRAVARHLRSSVRATDVVARIGGDEFAVLLPETDCDAAAVAMGHLGPETVLGDHRIGFSTGSVSYTTEPPPLDQVLAEADQAMYQQKALRRSRSGA
jgi:diguanylate cyclase (GGDEF)-like protein